MLISVFTPCYNSTATLERTFLSLKEQTNKNFEWIVIDDCSTDNGATRELIRKLVSVAPFPAKYFFFEQNSFGSKNYSKACELASGAFIAALAHDDEYLPNTIEVATTLIKEYCTAENIAGIAGRCLNQDGNLIGKKFKKDLQIDFEGNIRYLQEIDSELLNITRKAILEKYVQDFPKGASEGIFYARISENYKYLFSNQPLRIYHTNISTSITNSTGANVRFPHAIITQKISVWNSYSHLLKYRLLLLFKQALYCNYIAFKYDLSIQKKQVKSTTASIMLSVTKPLSKLRFKIDRNK